MKSLVVLIPALVAGSLGILSSEVSAKLIFSDPPGTRYCNPDCKFFVQGVSLQSKEGRVIAKFTAGLGAAECARRPGPWLNLILTDGAGNELGRVGNVVELQLPDAGTYAAMEIDITDKIDVDYVDASSHVKAFMPGRTGC